MQKRVRYVLSIALMALLGVAGCQSRPRVDGGANDTNGTSNTNGVQAAAATVSPVRFYIAQREAGDALQEVRLPDGSLYLQRVPVLTRDDLDAAQGLVDPQGVSYVGLRFNEAGALKLDGASRQNIGKLMAVVVNQQLVAAPRITDPLDRGVMAFEVASRDQALAIAAAIRGETLAEERSSSEAAPVR